MRASRQRCRRWSRPTKQRCDNHLVLRRPKTGSGQTTLKKILFFEFSLCLSRACLGKMFVFIYKRAKKTVFTHRRGILGIVWSAGHIDCKKRHFCAVYVSKRSFCQDRLGTNMGKTHKKWPFSHHRGRTAPENTALFSVLFAMFVLSLSW